MSQHALVRKPRGTQTARSSVGYFRSALCGFLIGCVLFSLAALYQLGAPTESSRWIYEMDVKKTSYATSIHQPKLLVTAGSNAQQGISCQIIEQELRIPCVNAAINAGLGTDYILHRAQVLAKPGDIVLLPLEYELYNRLLPSSLLIDYVFSRDPGYALSHPWLIRLLSFERLQLRIWNKFHPPAREAKERPINRNGDSLANLEANITPELRDKLNRETPFNIWQTPKYGTPGTHFIKSFARWCQKHQVQLLATWPNTLYFEVYQVPDYQEFFQDIEAFYRGLGVPVLGRYSDFLYDKSMLYDTYYHLHDRGRRQRTQQLISLLQPYTQKLARRQR